MQRLTAAMLTTAGDTRKKKTKPPSDDPKGTKQITHYGMLGAVTVCSLDVVANFANQLSVIFSYLIIAWLQSLGAYAGDATDTF